MTARIFVPDIPELMALIDGVRAVSSYAIHLPENGYWRIEDPCEIRLHRREIRLGPALWNSALVGGFQGRIMTFDRDTMVIMNV